MTKNFIFMYVLLNAALNAQNAEEGAKLSGKWMKRGVGEIW
jgi:hypothetical protein